LRRVNISLDSIDSEQFHRLTRGGDLERVLDAIDAARAAGLTPIKINVVVIGGENEEQVEALIERFVPEASNTEVRFIEYMPFHGNPRGWRHVAAQALRERIRLKWEFEEESTRVGGGPATHIRLRESGLRVGFISPITEHFCHACNRLRLQADGHLRTCLSREPQPSLRDLLRSGMSDEALDTVIRDRVWAKVAGHEAHLVEQRAFEGVMTRIGG
jgi:cyclic pyranopterin phosphate synthase